MTPPDLSWTSPRTGHEWRDDDLVLAATWLRTLVPVKDMERRLESARRWHLDAWSRRLAGERNSLFDPSDLAAWYVLQAHAMGTDRRFMTDEGTLSVVPYLKRLGQNLPLLLSVEGAEARAARMMTSERRQPDGPLFELLVALAYRRAGWDVRFVPEVPGGGRTPDLHVSRRGRRWAVECKRTMPSSYAVGERRRAGALSAPVHALALERYVAPVIEVVFKVELSEVPDDHLLSKVAPVLGREDVAAWNDDRSMGRVHLVDWSVVRGVMRHDDVYFGGSRMIELLAGSYRYGFEYDLSACWRASAERESYASAMYHASLVGWSSRSPGAIRKKARHFRKILRDAEGQLPDDRPGVIHVGMESRFGSEVDDARHLRNWIEASLFTPGTSRLRWTYGHYFVPEPTTDPDETWALTETAAPYRIGRHRTRAPLPDMLLTVPDEAIVPGGHWSRRPATSRSRP